MAMREAGGAVVAKWPADNLKIAVTGASGFIGRHLLAELVRQSAVPIVAITRTASRMADYGSTVRVVEMDIAQASADSYERLGRPDMLIHLAWDGLPNYQSLHHFETELPRQYRFLKGLVEAGLPAVLIAGTCLEYGMQSGALSENMPALPSTPYGHAKDTLRRQMEFLRGTHPFALTWVRLFYLYGDGQSPHSLYSQLKSAAMRGDRVFNMSGGEQLRDYLPVQDAASLIIQVAKHRYSHAIVNICTGRPISVRSLTESWIQQNAWLIKPNLGHYPYPDYEPLAFWGDSLKLRTCLSVPTNEDARL